MAQPAVDGGENAALSMSAGGIAALLGREGQRPHKGYYDDSGNNCTYGNGILVHLGRCTAEERRRTVDEKKAQDEFYFRVNEAARRVRHVVKHRQLTQNQFDALVSATFNTRTADNITFLTSADAYDDAAVERELRRLVYVHDHDAHGHPVGHAKRSQGLVNRRESEIRQYNRP